MDECELVALADAVTQARVKLDELNKLKTESIPAARKALARAERALHDATHHKDGKAQVTDLEILQARIDELRQQERTQ